VGKIERTNFPASSFGKTVNIFGAIAIEKNNIDPKTSGGITLIINSIFPPIKFL
tara:strand:+ start:1133 stop:1294 length:162 start_codon:yes stop_codon:yes gene_type:complete